MDVTQTDEVLADFFATYKIGGLDSDKDPTIGTFKCLVSSFKRQFSLRGLDVGTDNFPKTISTVNKRLNKLKKNNYFRGKKRKHFFH